MRLGHKLVGLFSSETELGVILLDETRSSIRLRKGQIFKGWTLVEVDPHAAFFESASGQEENGLSSSWTPKKRLAFQFQSAEMERPTLH